MNTDTDTNTNTDITVRSEGFPVPQVPLFTGPTLGDATFDPRHPAMAVAADGLVRCSECLAQVTPSLDEETACERCGSPEVLVGEFVVRIPTVDNGPVLFVDFRRYSTRLFVSPFPDDTYEDVAGTAGCTISRDVHVAQDGTQQLVAGDRRLGVVLGVHLEHLDPGMLVERIVSVDPVRYRPDEEPQWAVTGEMLLTYHGLAVAFVRHLSTSTLLWRTKEEALEEARIHVAHCGRILAGEDSLVVDPRRF